MSENYYKLVEYVKSLEVDVHKFYEKGQAAAGTRLRKGLSDLKRMAQEIRNDVQDVKATRKTPDAPKE
jgi:hypothetical protein